MFNYKILPVFIFGLFLIPFQATAVEKQVIAHSNQTILGEKTKLDGVTYQAQWTPSTEETNQALQAIVVFLEGANQNKDLNSNQQTEIKKIIRDIAIYNVQFAGIIVNHQKLIHCNFFPAPFHFNNWQQEYVYVIDGGSFFWRINYDILQQKCVDFRCNGYA